MTTEQQIIDNIKQAQFCGCCYFYVATNGFCNHILSNDKCADRDGEDSCNIGQFKYDSSKFSFIG